MNSSQNIVEAESVIKPKRPKGRGWVMATFPMPEELSMGFANEIWRHESGLTVISAVEVAAPEEGHQPLGPEYHISLTLNGKRADRNAARFIKRAFNMEDATEDNHVPGGMARNFWRPVADRLSGIECPCKEDEPAIAEDKGDYVWRAAPNRASQ